MTMNSGPSHIEIGVPDAKRFKAFFGSLLGWTFHPTGGGEQAWIDTGGVRGGLHVQDEPNSVTYYAVADIEAAVRAVREMGGEAGEPGHEEPGFGRFVDCRDDQGFGFGLHQLVRGDA